MSEDLSPIGHHIAGQNVFEGDLMDHPNPADNDKIVARSHDGTTNLMNQAIDAAHEAFDKWADVTPTLRGKVLARVAELLCTQEWRSRFVYAMVSEIGKTAGGADAEVSKAIDILEYMSGLPRHTRSDVIPGNQPLVHMYTTKEPAGVAGLITPFNFPLAVTIWKLAAALAAGCTTVIKPSPFAPMTSALIVELFQEAFAKIKPLKDANIGPGVINIVHGGPDIVSALINHQLIKALSFTGSTEAGKSILRQAMTREPMPIDPAHFLAEMGGHNAILVLADAPMDMAVDAAVSGMAVGEGQRCTATKRIFVDAGVADEFTGRFLAKLAELKVGPGFEPGVEVGPLVSQEAVKRFLAAVEESISGGMELLRGGKKLTGQDLDRGNFVEPTVLRGNPRDRSHLAMKREIFGPIAALATVHGFDEGVDAINDSTHRHVASIFTNNIQRGFQFARRVNAGMRHVRNTTLGGDPQAPFGGNGGDTSFGDPEMGKDAMRIFEGRATVGFNYGSKVLGGRDR